jgi:hypothetical protein
LEKVRSASHNFKGLSIEDTDHHITAINITLNHHQAWINFEIRIHFTRENLAMSEESKDQKNEGENSDQTKPVKGSLASKHDEEITVERTQKDVLCGRGVQVLHHVGNLRLHLAANEFREEYLRSRRDRKKEIIESIVITLKSAGSRFLRYSKRDKTKWVEAGDGFAYHKVSHVLRGQNTGKAVRKMKGQGRNPQNTSTGQPHADLPQLPLQPGGIAPGGTDNLTPTGANVPYVQALSNASLASNLNPSTLPGMQMQNNLRAGHNTTPFPPHVNMSLLLQQSNLFGNHTGVNMAELAAAANSVMASTMNYPIMNPRALYLAQQMNPGLPLPQQTYNFMSRAQMNPPMTAASQQLAANNSAQHLTAFLNNMVEARANDQEQADDKKGAHPRKTEPWKTIFSDGYSSEWYDVHINIVK